MFAKDILEKKWDKLCEMKERIRKIVVGSDFFLRNNKSNTDDTQFSLEPLFFFALEFLQNDRLNISSFCGILLWKPQSQQYIHHFDSDTNIFCKGTLLSELETIIETSATVSGLSFATTLAAVLDHFT